MFAIRFKPQVGTPKI